MNGFWHINLLHLFGFYLALMFVISVYLRLAQYRAIGALVVTGPGRWPRLIELMRQHGGVFMTWSTFLPALLALALTGIHWFASRTLWPHADVTPAGLAEHWLAWPTLAVLALVMLGVDGYCTFVVGDLDRATLEKYLDEAEYWLRSWTAPVVHILSLGTINPRRMVGVEVEKALQEASRLLNANLWWLVTQIGVRFVLGLALWLTYALS